MARQPAPPHLDEVMRRLADRQHGVVSRRQLRAAGVTVDEIERRMRSGHLISLHRGVYAVGHQRLRTEGVWLAAVLACGPGAALSHRDAGALWDIRRSSRVLTDVTVPTRNGRGRRPGITTHRPRTLSLGDAVRTHRGIPVTNPSRTLLDLADVVSPQALEKAFAQAEILRLYDRGELERQLASNPGRRGARAFTTALRSRTSGPRTRSDLEREFLQLCADHHIPRPQANVWIDPYEVDFLWPAHRLVVEIDSTTFHDTLTAFHDDRAKDAHLVTAGYTVLRFTDRQLETERDRIVRQLRTLLGA